MPRHDGIKTKERPVVLTETKASAGSAEIDASPQWEVVSEGNTACLVLTGVWLGQNTALPVFSGDALLHAGSFDNVTCNAADVTRWDTGLIGFLWDVRRWCDREGREFEAHALPHPMQQLLDLLPDRQAPTAPMKGTRHSFLERVGIKSIATLAEIGTIAELAGHTARACYQAIFRRGGLRSSDLFSDLFNAGPSALLIVGVVNFLIGAILAFVGAVQLQKFAAGIYVASLVGIATVREMAPVMTAIIMAGRTGGAYAARISTMQGNEEIDALKVFGISVSSYLILPAVLSLVITMPFLYLYGCLIGMLGGYIVAISMLDITSLGYFHQTVIAFGISQFIFGFIKSLVFGAFIGLTSCRIGLRAGRSAADVGIAATRAVVIGIVGVIALDAIFAIIANSIGI